MVLFLACITKKFQAIFILFCISLCSHTMGTEVEVYLWELHRRCTDKQTCRKELREERIENMPVVRAQERSPLLFKLKQKERHEGKPGIKFNQFSDYN